MSDKLNNSGSTSSATVSLLCWSLDEGAGWTESRWSTLNLNGDASSSSCLVSWPGKFCSLCFLSHGPSSTPQAIFPVLLWCGMCCGRWIGSVHTPSDSSEGDLRQSVVSQHLCKVCSPDVHVASYVLSTWSLLLKHPNSIVHGGDDE